MELDGDNFGSRLQERQRQSASSGTKIDDQLARANGRASNDALSPVRIHSVPAPWPPPGHDAPRR
jgi:hypothetical protein